jgi:hypothetical protein
MPTVLWKVRVVALMLLALLVAGGCSGGRNGNTRPTPILGGGAETTAQSERLAGKSQGATLTMARGRSKARFNITGLDPPTHVFDVRVVAPASADVRVRMRTANGRLLHVLDSTRNKDWCKVRHRRAICQLPFPALEAQLGGRWTVIVMKRSDPPASVRVGVTFRTP